MFTSHWNPRFRSITPGSWPSGMNGTRAGLKEKLAVLVGLRPLPS